LRQATLHFSAEAAQWVAQEEWHPQQQLKPGADGSLRMRLPYSDHTELVMDVLRHGPNVRVLSPPELVEQVREQLQQTLAAYGDKAAES
ncbi:MAG: WYL domain-containing protein, partial [Caulobacter sp.]|nr:WYL domain-containing protein [Vitreoscilla sp.]